MQRVREFIERRGWVLKTAQPDTLEADLECAAVLWYLSDWEPPAEFADVARPAHRGLRAAAAAGSWSAGSAGRTRSRAGRTGTAATAPYAADVLGKPFGFAFTRDAFESPGDTPITLQSGQ